MISADSYFMLLCDASYVHMTCL